MSKYVKMFMGIRENFDRSVKKDGLKEASVYLNADTGELYFVYDNAPILISNSLEIELDNAHKGTVDFMEETPEIPDTFSGAPLIGRISLNLWNFDLKNRQEGF